MVRFSVAEEQVGGCHYLTITPAVSEDGPEETSGKTLS